METAADGIITVDEHGTVLSVNRRGGRRVGAGGSDRRNLLKSFMFGLRAGPISRLRQPIFGPITLP